MCATQAFTHKLQLMAISYPGIAAGCILLLGKSGAGVSTLVRHLHKDEEDYSMLPPLSPCTTSSSSIPHWRKEEITRKYMSIEVIFGGLGRGEEKQLKKLIGDRAHILVYCLSIAPTSPFQTDPSLSSLQAQFGKKMWEHCVVVFTFSNLFLEYLMEKHDRQSHRPLQRTPN